MKTDLIQTPAAPAAVDAVDNAPTVVANWTHGDTKESYPQDYTEIQSRVSAAMLEVHDGGDWTDSVTFDISDLMAAPRHVVGQVEWNGDHFDFEAVQLSLYSSGDNYRANYQVTITSG